MQIKMMIDFSAPIMFLGKGYYVLILSDGKY